MVKVVGGWVGMSKARPTIKVEDDIIHLATNWAATGIKLGKLGVDYKGAKGDRLKFNQVRDGKVAEAACAMTLGLDPYDVVAWEQYENDGGCDLLLPGGFTCDVKSTRTGYQYLMLPKGKPMPDVDYLALLIGDRELWAHQGYCTMAAFRAHSRVNLEATKHLRKGTIYVDIIEKPDVISFRDVPHVLERETKPLY